MSNARTFIWLFVYVQILFISLDLYEHWRLTRSRTFRQTLRQYRSLIAAVTAACLVYFVIQIGLAALLPNVGRLSDYVIRAAHLREIQPNAAWSVPVFVGAFLVGSLFDYLVHRFLLHGILWKLHENHHLPSVVSNVMPGIAARPFVVVPNFLINISSCAAIFGIVRLIGRPQLISTFIQVVPALLLAFAFVASASHSIFLRRFNSVETAFHMLRLITPREHLVHHSANIPGNYGNFTALWDQAFGTYVPPQNEDFPVGLSYDQDFLGAISGGHLKLPSRMRSQYQIGQVCHLSDDAGSGSGNCSGTA